MKITTKSIYAIRALHTLNMLSEECKPVGIATLSEKLGLSNKYLEQIFSSLKKASWLFQQQESWAATNWHDLQKKFLFLMLSLLWTADLFLFTVSIIKTVQYVQTVLFTDFGLK